MSKLHSLLAFTAPKEEDCPDFFATLLAFAELEEDCPELGARCGDGGLHNVPNSRFGQSR